MVAGIPEVRKSLPTTIAYLGTKVALPEVPLIFAFPRMTYTAVWQWPGAGDQAEGEVLSLAVMGVACRGKMELLEEGLEEPKRLVVYHLPRNI